MTYTAYLGTGHSLSDPSVERHESMTLFASDTFDNAERDLLDKHCKYPVYTDAMIEANGDLCF